MAIRKATIRRGKTDNRLVLETSGKPLEIVLTDDNPNNVMSAFNSLLLDLKKGMFSYELEDTGNDLYFHICVEYIKQLNAELKTVHGELKEYDLLEKQPPAKKK